MSAPLAPLAGLAAALVIGWAAAAFVLRDRIWPVGQDVDAVDVGAALATALLLVLMAAGVESPLRVLLALAFVSFVPGWAVLGLIPPLQEVSAEPPWRVVDLVPLVDGVAKVALAVALSLTICVASTQALLWTRVWNPTATMGALGGLSLLALAARLATAR